MSATIQSRHERTLVEATVLEISGVQRFPSIYGAAGSLAGTSVVDRPRQER